MKLQRRRWLVGSTCAVLACRARAPEQPTRPHPPGLFRVLTLNLAHGRGRSALQSTVRPERWYRANLDTIAKLLEQQAADVVGLQEAELGSRWAGSFDHVGYLAEQARYPHVVATPHVQTEGKSYGTALLSRLPLTDSKGHSFERQGRWEKGFTTALVETSPEVPPVVAVSLHLDFARAAVRRRQIAEVVDTLLELRAMHRDVLHVVMGDFNDPGLDPDDPAAVAMRALGLHTAAARAPRATHPSTGRRLDWILASKGLAFVDYRVVREAKVADHRPVVADLEFPKARDVQPRASAPGVEASGGAISSSTSSMSGGSTSSSKSGMSGGSIAPPAATSSSSSSSASSPRGTGSSPRASRRPATGR